MTVPKDLAGFSLNAVPEIHFGARRAGRLAEDAAAMGVPGKSVVFMVDAVLAELGVAAKLATPLKQAGAKVETFADIAGEPKEKQLEAACAFTRDHDAGLVVCLGGGSAMDIGKVAATVARSGEGPVAFAMQAQPLPKRSIPKICIPTTAGTGSELSATNIFTSAAGKKVWVWGQETKPQRVILDPELTTTLPPALTAWTGLDAFVHALEACTNRQRHPGNDLYAHRALALIAGALETAVQEPENLRARGDMLMGSAYAGIAIDNCGVAVAHNISHALAALAPIHHGFATALGQDAVLAWEVERDNGSFAAAASACGLEQDASALVQWYGDFTIRCGMERRLPESFKAFSVADLAAEMQAPETQVSRNSTARDVTDADIDRFAAAILALA